MPDREVHSIRDVAEAFGTTVATLRYYDELGLVPATTRQARVRFYDDDALRRLAFVQLWHDDAMMTLDDTAKILAGPQATEHWRELVAQRVDDLTSTVERLRQAIDALTHLGQCPRDDPLSCPVTAERLEARVAKAITG